MPDLPELMQLRPQTPKISTGWSTSGSDVSCSARDWAIDGFLDITPAMNPMKGGAFCPFFMKPWELAVRIASATR